MSPFHPGPYPAFVNIKLLKVCEETTSDDYCNKTSDLDEDLYKTGKLSLSLIIAAVCYAAFMAVGMIMQSFMKKCNTHLMLLEIVHNFFFVAVCESLLAGALTGEISATDDYAVRIALHDDSLGMGHTFCCMSLAFCSASCLFNILLTIAFCKERKSEAEKQPLIGTPSSA